MAIIIIITEKNMLIKLITTRGTTKIIEGIVDIDVHHDYYHLHSDDTPDLSLAMSDGPIPHGAVAVPASPRKPMPVIAAIKGDFNAVWGWAFHDEMPAPDKGPLKVLVIDFKDKDGIWTRLAVARMAYICNDQGKTLDKVENHNWNDHYGFHTNAA